LDVTPFCAILRDPTRFRAFLRCSTRGDLCLEGYFFEETGGSSFWEGHSERFGTARASGFLWDVTPFRAILRDPMGFCAFSRVSTRSYAGRFFSGGLF
jgi:hypothetical protein